MSEKKIGAKQRKANRNAQKAKVKNEIIEIIDHELTCLDMPEAVTKEFFLREIDTILNSIQVKYNNKMMRFAYNNIRSRSEEKAYDGKLQIPILPKLWELKHKPPFRDESWFVGRSQFIDLMNLINPSNLKVCFHSQDNVLCIILLNSMAYGGLNSIDPLLELANQLNRNEKILKKFDTTYWIDLLLENNRKPFNYIFNDKKINLRRWYPDTITLMWILRYHKKERKLVGCFTKNNLWDILKKFISGIADNNNLNISQLKNLKKLVAYSIGYVELLSGVSLNQILIGYATEKNYSASVNPNEFGCILNDNFKISNKPVNTPNQKSIKQELLTDELLISEINKILRPSDKRKPSISVVISGLEKVPIRLSNDYQYCLVSWFIHNLEYRNNKVSTIGTYLSNIGKQWLTASKNDVDVTDIESLSSFYESLINDNKDKNSSFQSILGRFHQYAHVYHGFAEVQTFENQTKPQPFVMSGFIPESVFFVFLNNISKSLDPPHIKNMWMCYFIVLYRTGLRSSEIRGLRIRDVENSADLWLYVRGNQFKNNKSPSGRRKHPLGLLLLEDEKKIVQAYLSQKLVKPNVSLKSLFFSFDTTPNQPLSKTVEYQQISEHLNGYYQQNWVTHHFRHTALNSLYVILSDNLNLIKLLTNYSKEQVQSIQSHFYIKGKNTFWNLAAIAGHSSPAVSMKNYIHFIDYILYSELIKHDALITYEYILNSTLCNRQYIDHHLKTNANNNETFELQKVRQALRNELKKISTDVKVRRILPKNQKLTFLNFKTTPYDMVLLLKELEDGLNLHEIASRHLIDRKLLEKWNNNALSISRLKNQKGNPKFFNKVLVNRNTNLLAPREPRSTYEMNIARKILDDSIAIYEKSPENFRKVLIYFLNNSVGSKVVFGRPDELFQFLSILSVFFNKKHIVIHLIVDKNEKVSNQKKAWKDAILGMASLSYNPKERINKRHKYKQGKATLEIRHPQEDKIINKSAQNRNVKVYTSNVLKFAFHTLAIFLLDLQKKAVDSIKPSSEKLIEASTEQKKSDTSCENTEDKGELIRMSVYRSDFI